MQNKNLACNICQKNLEFQDIQVNIKFEKTPEEGFVNKLVDSFKKEKRKMLKAVKVKILFVWNRIYFVLKNNPETWTLRSDTKHRFCSLLFLTISSQEALIFDKMVSHIDWKSSFNANAKSANGLIYSQLTRHET